MSNWLGLRDDQQVGAYLSKLLMLEVASVQIRSRPALARDSLRSARPQVNDATPSQANLRLQPGCLD